MKKGYLICLFCFISFFSYSQSFFELKPYGFVDRKDSTKSYIVLNYEGKTQQELFKQFLEKFTIMYVSPQNVISSVPNSTITINGVSDEDIPYEKDLIDHYYNLNYTIVFQFKDGKVRINSMSINKLYVSYNQFYREVSLQDYIDIFSYKRAIYNLDGKLRDAELKDDLEGFFNGLIGRVLSAGSDDQNW